MPVDAALVDVSGSYVSETEEKNRESIKKNSSAGAGENPGVRCAVVCVKCGCGDWYCLDFD